MPTQAAGGSFTGYLVTRVPEGVDVTSTGTIGTADDALAFPVILPGPMRVRALWVAVSSSGTGSLQWGLFDYSSSATAATKVAGGTAATGGTGYRALAATSAPVDVAAGAYMLIIKWPAANIPTLNRSVLGISGIPWNKKIASYTWTDTPNLTTGWSDATGLIDCFLQGDIDGSGTSW